MKIQLTTEVPNSTKGKPPYPAGTKLDVLPGYGKRLVEEGKAVDLGDQIWETDRQYVKIMEMEAMKEEEE